MSDVPRMDRTRVKVSTLQQQGSEVLVAAVQASCGESLSHNVAHAIEKIREAAALGANVVCLQELFNGRYFCQSEEHKFFETAESIPGPTIERLQTVARELSIIIIAPIFERRTAGLFHNSAAIIERDGSLKGTYRKMHIPDDPSFMEKFYFTPGDAQPGFQNWQTSVGDLGVCICWDQWFPEAARITSLCGAKVLFYPTAIGWLAEDKQAYGESQLNAWKTMMRSHAIANGVFVVAVNRVGTEDAIEFWGNSFICDPYGNLLTEGSRTDEQVLIAECDLSLIETARTHWPFLRDRRIDAYHGLTHRLLDKNPRQ